LTRAVPQLSRAELRQRIRDRIDRDAELVIAPELFDALRSRVPAITDVSVRLKRGRLQNEMTRFRYDVVLSVGRSTKTPARTIERDEPTASIPSIAKELSAGPEAVVFRGLPNARIAADVAAVVLLGSDDCPSTAGEIRDRIADSAQMGVD